LLGIIPLVNWIVIGYAARVLRESPGTETPPKLERYGEMFADGTKVFFVTLIYMIIPTVLLAAGLFSIFMGVFFRGEGIGSAMTFGGAGLVLFLAGIVLAFFFLIILGAGMAHMIKTRKFGKAFAFGEIFAIIRGIGWGKYLGWVILTAVIAIVVGTVAGAIPIVGWLISLIISPILTVFIFRSLGLLYNEGAPPELKAQAISVTAAGITCASCGNPLEPFQKFCPKCGAAAPIPSVPPPPPPPTSGGTKYCINCGASIPAGAVFCGSCGTKQT
jgi:ribosomal protein L40E